MSVVFGALTISGSVWNATHAEIFEGEFDDILVSARQIRQLIDSHQDYDLIVVPAILQYRIQVDAYIAHFLPADTIRTVAFIRDTYKIIATTDSNWMGSE